MSDKLCIDLCSGLGGFSQAFVDAGWEVVTVDIDPKFGPTLCADVTALSAADIEKATDKGAFSAYEKVVVLASPPCERFTVASHSWPKVGIKKAMEMVGSIFEIIAELRPDYYLVENPMGRLRWFLGKPKSTLRLCDYGSPYRKLTDFWGNIPLPMVDQVRQHTHYVETETVHNVKKPLPRLTNNRAKKAQMPYGLSQAVLEAVSEPHGERQAADGGR